MPKFYGNKVFFPALDVGTITPLFWFFFLFFSPSSKSQSEIINFRWNLAKIYTKAFVLIQSITHIYPRGLHIDCGISSMIVHFVCYICYIAVSSIVCDLVILFSTVLMKMIKLTAVLLFLTYRKSWGMSISVLQMLSAKEGSTRSTIL